MRLLQRIPDTKYERKERECVAGIFLVFYYHLAYILAACIQRGKKQTQFATAARQKGRQ